MVGGMRFELTTPCAASPSRRRAFRSRKNSFSWSGRADLNRRPLAPQASALNRTALRPVVFRSLAAPYLSQPAPPRKCAKPGCATPRPLSFSLDLGGTSHKVMDCYLRVFIFVKNFKNLRRYRHLYFIFLRKLKCALRGSDTLNDHLRFFQYIL